MGETKRILVTGATGKVGWTFIDQSWLILRSMRSPCGRSVTIAFWSLDLGSRL